MNILDRMLIKHKNLQNNTNLASYKKYKSKRWETIEDKLVGLDITNEANKYRQNNIKKDYVQLIND